MRLILCTAVLMTLTACFPTRPLARTEVVTVAKPGKAREVPVAKAVSPAVPVAIRSREIAGITFEGVAFDSRQQRLVVADQAAGPGTQFADAAAAAASRGGLVALNAGFFTPTGAPLGLVVAGGKIAGAWNSTSSLGSGIWSENKGGAVAITRRGRLNRTAAAAMRELIQAGPLLVEDGSGIGGLDAEKSSARSLLLWDGGTQWWLGRSSPCSLAAVSQALATASPAGWSVRQALNLDGGRSADLWISGTLAGGPLVRRPPWNRPVRNFLVLVPQ
jgi:Phosphodiester glycosidase